MFPCAYKLCYRIRYVSEFYSTCLAQRFDGPWFLNLRKHRHTTCIMTCIIGIGWHKTKESEWHVRLQEYWYSRDCRALQVPNWESIRVVSVETVFPKQVTVITTTTAVVILVLWSLFQHLKPGTWYWCWSSGAHSSWLCILFIHHVRIVRRAMCIVKHFALQYSKCSKQNNTRKHCSSSWQRPFLQLLLFNLSQCIALVENFSFSFLGMQFKNDWFKKEVRLFRYEMWFQIIGRIWAK